MAGSGASVRRGKPDTSKSNTSKKMQKKPGGIKAWMDRNS